MEILHRLNRGTLEELARSVAREHGRTQAFLRHQVARTLDGAGVLRPLAAVDFGRVERLVFVCRGNLCRSAYAEARAKSLSLAAASAGLAAPDGAPADLAAVRVAARRGIDLSAHRSKPLSDLAVGTGDLLLGMELAHAPRLLQLSWQKGAQFTLAGLWSVRRRPHLEDPYGLGDDYFDTCFSILDEAVAALWLLAGGAHAA